MLVLLPRHIDVLQWTGEGHFIWGVPHCAMYFVMATCEVTTLLASPSFILLRC